MPINVRIGSTVEFTVEFFDVSGVLTVPSSATLTISYPTLANSLTIVSCAIDMTQSGSFFTATWGTGAASLGLSSYSVSAPGQASPTAGTLRLMS